MSTNQPIATWWERYTAGKPPRWTAAELLFFYRRARAPHLDDDGFPVQRTARLAISYARESALAHDCLMHQQGRHGSTSAWYAETFFDALPRPATILGRGEA